MDSVIAIILNWNGAEDTIECLRTLDNFNKGLQCIVVDNFSEDQSLKKIMAYLSEEKIHTFFLNEDNIENVDECVLLANVIVISAKENYGYAGGNNLGLKFVREKMNKDFVWILNNDTKVTRDSLSELLFSINENERIGFVSSVLVYEDKPDVIQCAGGGRVYPLLGKCTLALKGQPLKSLLLFDDKKLEFLMGASLLLRTSLIREIGYIPEKYFMYYEETDWQKNAVRNGWLLKVSKKSIVLHGDSGSTKNSKFVYHYYRNRAALIFSKEYGYNVFITAINLAVITIIQNTNSFKNIKYGISGIYDAFRGITGRKQFN